jgi:hypothetical protein
MFPMMLPQGVQVNDRAEVLRQASATEAEMRQVAREFEEAWTNEVSAPWLAEMWDEINPWLAREPEPVPVVVVARHRSVCTGGRRRILVRGMGGGEGVDGGSRARPRPRRPPHPPGGDPCGGAGAGPGGLPGLPRRLRHLLACAVRAVRRARRRVFAVGYPPSRARNPGPSPRRPWSLRPRRGRPRRCRRKASAPAAARPQGMGRSRTGSRASPRERYRASPTAHPSGWS